MKPGVRNRNSDIQILELQEAFLSIESLEEYYSNSILNVQKMKIQIEKEYQIGLFVDAEIKRAIDAKTKEEAISIINELNNGIAPDDNPISDYIVVEFIEADEDLEFSYSIKKNARVKSKYIDPQNAKRQYNKIEQYESILIQCHSVYEIPWLVFKNPPPQKTHNLNENTIPPKEIHEGDEFKAVLSSHHIAPFVFAMTTEERVTDLLQKYLDESPWLLTTLKEKCT